MPSVIEWDIGISMLSQYDEDEFLEAQIDAEGEDRAGVHPYELHHPYGFKGRPLDPIVDGRGVPDPTTANQLLFGLEGGRGHALALQNPSVVKKLPLVKKGESLQYAWRGNFVRCMDDGSIGLWCPATDGGVDFSGTFGADGIFFAGRWGTFELSDNGFHVKHASGARIDLGGMGGLPAPLSALASYCNISAASVDVQATAVMLGPDDPAGAPPVSLTNAQTLAGLLSLVQTALTQIATALTTFVPGTGGASIPNAAAAATAVAACSALSSALVTLSTNAKATV